jgi:hypothetical protein
MGFPASAATLICMTVPGRAKTVRRNRRSASQMIVAGLVVLAVAASLFMIFSESVQLLRVGLVIALWAATLGAIAMTKYRRESALDKAKVRDLQKVYELQLEREITARREYELGVEARVRGELGAETETIKALRDELAALRRSLEVLFDGRLPEDRVALRAESTRVQELAGTYQPAASGLFVPGAQASAQKQPQPQQQPTPRGPGFAGPNDDPVTAETTVIPPLDAETLEPAVDEPATAKAEAGSARDIAPETDAVDAETVALDSESQTRAEPDAGSGGGESPSPRRSRRLAEDSDGAHTNGLSVAEIMANLKSAESGDGAPRRRRRAD